jgi:hypothetical protein
MNRGVPVDCGQVVRGRQAMIQSELGEIPEASDLEKAEVISADELALVTRTPNAEEALLDIERHLRDIGMYGEQ